MADSTDSINAAETILECHRVLNKTGSNIVREILEYPREFVQWAHYPEGDVFDSDTHSQYYYHAHPPRARETPKEHGHFHCFLRKEGMPPNLTALVMPNNTDDNTAELSHLIAIAMDAMGLPIGLFTTNRWVTGEAWYSAEDVIHMIDHFEIDHAWPSWPTNLWLTNMVLLYKSDIIELIKQRDITIDGWQTAHPEHSVFEDRQLEITSYRDINLQDKIAALSISA